MSPDPRMLRWIGTGTVVPVRVQSYSIWNCAEGIQTGTANVDTLGGNFVEDWYHLRHCYGKHAKI
jgi:hypothetical protein